MYMTLSQESPCAKIVADWPYSMIVFETPAESRNACAAAAGALKRLLASPR
jgi:hypothetical protein